MRRFSLFLLSTAAFLPQAAFAADVGAADAAAADGAADGATGDADTEGAIVVFGQGQSKQVQ